MLALKDECMHPVNGKPYIKTSTGGQDNSIEDLQVSQPQTLPASESIVFPEIQVVFDK